MKAQLSTQISVIQESVSNLASMPNITEESIIQTVLNIMPLILFSRAIILAILTYFLAIFTLKKIRKNNIKETLKLSERIYHCECCGLEIDRDYNASINILRKGLEILKEEKVS